MEGGRGLLSHQDLSGISQGLCTCYQSCMHAFSPGQVLTCHCVCFCAQPFTLLLSGTLFVRPGQVITCHCVCVSVLRLLHSASVRDLACQARPSPHLSFCVLAFFAQAPVTLLAQGSCVCVCISSPVGLFTLLDQGPSLSLCCPCSCHLPGVLAASSWAMGAHADALVRTSCCFAASRLLSAFCHHACLVQYSLALAGSRDMWDLIARELCK